MRGQHYIDHLYDTDPEFRRQWIEHRRSCQLEARLLRERRERILAKYLGSKDEILGGLAEKQKMALRDLGLSEENIQDLLRGIDIKEIQVAAGESDSVSLADFVMEKTIKQDNERSDFRGDEE